MPPHNITIIIFARQNSLSRYASVLTALGVNQKIGVGGCGGLASLKKITVRHGRFLGGRGWSRRFHA